MIESTSAYWQLSHSESHLTPATNRYHLQRTIGSVPPFVIDRYHPHTRRIYHLYSPSRLPATKFKHPLLQLKLRPQARKSPPNEHPFPAHNHDHDPPQSSRHRLSAHTLTRKFTTATLRIYIPPNTILCHILADQSRPALSRLESSSASRPAPLNTLRP